MTEPTGARRVVRRFQAQPTVVMAALRRNWWVYILYLTLVTQSAFLSPCLLSLCHRGLYVAGGGSGSRRPPTCPPPQTRAAVEKLFHLPIGMACEKLGVCLTHLKKYCR